MPKLEMYIYTIQYLNYEIEVNYKAFNDQKQLGFKSIFELFKNINLLKISVLQDWLKMNLGDITFLVTIHHLEN